MDSSSVSQPPEKLEAVPVAIPVETNDKPSPNLWHTFKLLYLIFFIFLVIAISVYFVFKSSPALTTHNSQLTTNHPLPSSSAVTYTYPPAAISTWQPYESPIFSLRYPPDWKTGSDQSNNLFLISSAYSYLPKDGKPMQNINYMIMIYPFDFTTKTVDEAVAADYFRFTNTKNIGNNITRNPLTINFVPYQQIIGFPAEMFSVYFSNNQEIYRTSLVAAGYGNYQFTLLANPATAGIVNNFYSIISTVTTDKTLDTSSWEEYANNTYKFSAKLPSILGFGADLGFGVYFDFPRVGGSDTGVKDSLYFIEATDSAKIRDILGKPKEGDIAGLPFWRESTTQTDNSPSEIITYIARNGSLFKIMLRNYTGKYVGVYNRIIATLKFL